MHQPETRSITSIAYVVVVCDEVPQSKRARLEKDGAKVVVVDSISDAEWLATIKQYQGVMTRLRIFQQTEYEKVLYRDADNLITRRMDAVFEDEGTKIQRPKEDKTRIPRKKQHRYSLPSCWQGKPRNSNVCTVTHQILRSVGCASVSWSSPSQEIFEYYVSILEGKNSSDPQFPDQNLLNYAHRRDGPMPWTNVYYQWTSTYPTIKEYAMGAAALHEK